jgi:hypothetical protein
MKERNPTWIRCIFSITSFPEKVIKEVNQYNLQEKGTKFPLILLQGNAWAFGNRLYNKLVSEVKR